MRHSLPTILLHAVTLIASTLCAIAADSLELPEYRVKTCSKKLIHFGWSEPQTIEQFNGSVEALNATCPFDGIGIRPPFYLKRNGKTIKYAIDKAHGNPIMLNHDDFKEWLPALRHLQETRLKHNFILTASCLFNANWFDDDMWSRTINNFETLAWLAHEAQFDGICLDLEAYRHCGMPFKFRPDLGHSLAETQLQVRRRAAQWIRAITAQFPQITLFTFFWTSQCNSEYMAAHPESLYSGNHALQIAFINGVYDAAPDDMKIIDGNENPGYQAVTPKDYKATLADFYRFGKAWLDPRHYAKYDRITSLACALYLDSYVPRPNPGHWNHFEKTDNPTTLLFNNIAACMEYSGEYAWVWAEHGTFWNKLPGKESVPHWNSRLPFATEAIEAGRNPDNLLPFAGENIFRNSALDVGAADVKLGPGQKASPIKFWSQYQDADLPQGTISPEKGMVRIKDAGSACISQALPAVKAGQKFLLTARAKVECKNATPTLTYFYRNKDGKGLWSLTGHAVFSTPDKDGWLKASTIITVPDNSDIRTMTVSCGARAGFKGDKDDNGVLIDDIELRPIKYPWDK